MDVARSARRAGHEVRGFPALVDEGESVGLQVYGSEDEQLARHRLGVRRLLQLELPDPTKRIVDGFGNREKLALAGSPYPTVAELLEGDGQVLLEVGERAATWRRRCRLPSCGWSRGPVTCSPRISRMRLTGGWLRS